MISVFTPTHDASYLNDAYQSLRRQTYDQFEWLIILNGQLNRLPADFNDPRVKIFRAPQLSGNVGALKRFACQHAQGDIMVELDHDDMLVPECLDTIQKALDPAKNQFGYSDFAAVRPDMTPIDYGADWGWETYAYNFQGHALKASRAFDICPLALSCLPFAPNHVRAWTRFAMEHAGGYSENYELVDDLELMIRCYLQGVEFVHIPECLYVYRVHDKGTSTVRNQTIQDLQQRLVNAKISDLILEWTRRKNLKNYACLISRGEETYFEKLYPLDGVRPTNNQLHFSGLSELPDNSAGQIVCRHVLPYLPPTLVIPFFEECYRVLAPGGWLRCTAPTTEGTGAFANPLYRSYWNEVTFQTFCDSQAAAMAGGHKCRFQLPRVWQTWFSQAEHDRRAFSVCADLIALKGQRQPGLTAI